MARHDELDQDILLHAVSGLIGRAMPHTLRARRLRTTIEEILLDVMYEIPSFKNVRKCIVDENVISNGRERLRMTVGDQKIPYAESA